MRKGLCLLVVLGAVALCVLKAQAVTTSGPITVTAQIQSGTPDMTVTIHKLPNGDYNLINWSETITSMAFDKFNVLQRTGKDPQWTSVDHFATFVYANGMGKQYQIKSTGRGAFSDGAGHTLPAGSFACTPVYSATDKWKYPDGSEMVQGAKPGTASLGSAGQALTTNKLIYTSENPGSARIIQTHYSFPPYNVDGGNPYSGYAPIPSNQANGTYTGAAVTLTIAVP